MKAVTEFQGMEMDSGGIKGQRRLTEYGGLNRMGIGGQGREGSKGETGNAKDILKRCKKTSYLRSFLNIYIHTWL